jgi:hypothetical protein
MTCSCGTGKGNRHIAILCATCQVADFMDMLFGIEVGAVSEQEANKPADKKQR